MPIFEYKCKKCGHVMEFLEKSANASKHICEKCKGSSLEKVLSTFSTGQESGSKSQDNGSCPTGTCPFS